MASPIKTKWYRIWSFEHNAWWAPRQRGYRQSIDEAGIYGYIEATQIVGGANVGCPDDKPNEEMRLVLDDCGVCSFRGSMAACANADCGVRRPWYAAKPSSRGIKLVEPRNPKPLDPPMTSEPEVVEAKAIPDMFSEAWWGLVGLALDMDRDGKTCSVNYARECVKQAFGIEGSRPAEQVEDGRIPLNPMEAPEGYMAIPSHSSNAYSSSCTRCFFEYLGDEGCEHKCMPSERQDCNDVIFINIKDLEEWHRILMEARSGE